MKEAVEDMPDASGWKVEKILKLNLHLSFYNNK